MLAAFQGFTVPHGGKKTRQDGQVIYGRLLILTGRLVLAKRVIEHVRNNGLRGEGLRYVIAGGLTTLINFGLFALLHEVLGIDDIISNVSSISASIIFAYVANKLGVFKRRTGSLRELALEFSKFIGSRLFTMALEVGLVWMFVRVLETSAMLGKSVSLVLVVILNYIISKLIVFRNKNEETDP